MTRKIQLMSLSSSVHSSGRSGRNEVTAKNIAGTRNVRQANAPAMVWVSITARCTVGMRRIWAEITAV
jgi:hypothetical protein